MRQKAPPELRRVGVNVRRLRKALGYNQTSLAYKAGTRPSTISQIETGVSANPGWQLVSQIAQVLDTNIHDLTRADSSTVSSEQAGELPPGLVELSLNQDSLLAPSEPRVSLAEVDWLQRIPSARAADMLAGDYLLLLRFFRLFDRERFERRI